MNEIDRDPVGIIRTMVLDVAERTNISVDVLLQARSDRSDWGFVIKAHSLMETAITHLVEEMLPKKFSPVVRRISLLGYAGKVEFIKQEKLFNKELIKFIKNFTELRNHLIHDVRNL